MQQNSVPVAIYERNCKSRCIQVCIVIQCLFKPGTYTVWYSRDLLNTITCTKACFLCQLWIKKSTAVCPYFFYLETTVLHVETIYRYMYTYMYVYIVWRTVTVAHSCTVTVAHWSTLIVDLDSRHVAHMAHDDTNAQICKVLRYALTIIRNFISRHNGNAFLMMNLIKYSFLAERKAFRI